MAKQELEFDQETLSKMERAFNEYDQQAQVGDYWRGYVASILEVMRKDGLSGFGDDYFLTQGFGDSLKYHAARVRIRKLLRSPKLYAPIEKALVVRSQKIMAKTLFANHGSILRSSDFAKHLVGQLDSATRALGISRYFEIEGNRAPWRYWMFLVYLEMLQRLADNAGIDADELLAGDYLDIGGGYGSSVDGMAVYKRYRRIGGGTANYDIDQFPVTFIANQYLKYRNPKSHFAPIANDSDFQSMIREKSKKDTYCCVIQNNTVGQIANLRISLFFNSNSFQEMDSVQVEEYCRFMKVNSADTAFLGAYFYDSTKESNNPARPLEILNRHFTLLGEVGAKEFFATRGVPFPDGRVVKGGCYLFKVR